MFYGSVIFQFVGVLFRWIIINLFVFLRLSNQKKYLNFKTVWNGLEGENDSYGLTYDFTNIIL